MNQKCYDVIGIGIGPANLSTAALLQGCPNTRSLFLEKKPFLQWHPNMMFDFSCINVGFQKDLVTLVDPTNPFSFMNYLVKNRKQYLFFNAAFNRVPRLEFEAYYQWAAKSLENTRFATDVQSIQFQPKHNIFELHTNKGSFTAKHLISGTGIRPKMPAWARSLDPSRVYHCYDHLNATQKHTHKKLLIIGGGQSAAEILYSLIHDETSLPDEIVWVSSKGYPVMLDENPFANDLYTPTFSEQFFQLNQSQRDHYNGVLRDTSDGIQINLLEKIYQQLYFLTHIKHHKIQVTFLPSTKVTQIQEESDGLTAETKGFFSSVIDKVDIAILCTGYIQNNLSLLEGLKEYIQDKPIIQKDFSIKPHVKTDCKIFVNNGAQAFFGPADPNLSLIAWRSAKIINALTSTNRYPVDFEFGMMKWLPTSPTQQSSYESGQYESQHQD